jgi:hypothetical protein
MRRTELVCEDVTPRGPLDHFDVRDDEPCACSVCTAWFAAKREADAASAARPPHPPTCNCRECVPARRARYRLQALNARRDLWIEMSYHASMHKVGEPYMAWLAAEMADDRKTLGWWANEASRFPLAYWFKRFEQAVRSGVVSLSGAVSGVFNFAACYLDVDPEGGGEASMSSLFIDDEYGALLPEADAAAAAPKIGVFDGLPRRVKPGSSVFAHRSHIAGIPV